MKKIFIFAFIMQHLLAFPQKDQITGSVNGLSIHHEVETHDKNEKHTGHLHTEPLPGASVFWAGTTMGTVTGLDGGFTLPKPPANKNKLVVSYVGYKNDTLLIKDFSKPINIVLASGDEMDEVVVRERIKGVYLSKAEPIKSETITSSGLKRLACCNLSESFENNATVDVGYSDAVSGAKQIKMLGLAGVYSQLLSENIPSIRGLATTYGLNYVPGSWMESIQISKGTAAVINGYESVTGQINVEFKKPKDSSPLFVNLYGNSFGKGEVNITSAHDVGKKWGTMVLAHGAYNNKNIDDNNDGFLDMPKNRQINLYNRWKYTSASGSGQIGVKILDEQRDGGQVAAYKGSPTEQSNAYGIGINTKRYQLYGKRGFILDNKGSSLGLLASASLYDQSSVFGNNRYEGDQNSIYTNAIFQLVFDNPAHKVSTGLSYQFDDYKEQFNDTVFKRTEHVPGVFGQYTYSIPEKFSLIAGLRYDHNSWFGHLVTPRLHFKWNVTDKTIVRGSAGRGYRSANVFAEHVGLMATSRSFVFEDKFDIEEAWNYGVNMAQDFRFLGPDVATFTVDFYRTDFMNRVVVDLDQNFNEVHFYNLKGRSFSNSLQTGLNFVPVKRLEIGLAYRFNDVYTTYNGELRKKPFVKTHKGLVTLSYATHNDKWQFDVTNQFVGKSRLPNTNDIPVNYSQREYSPRYYVLHAQITRQFKHFEVYAGGENLTGFKQPDPIIAANDPFGKYFDTSFVWGPILGRKIYLGLRYSL